MIPEIQCRDVQAGERYPHRHNMPVRSLEILGWAQPEKPLEAIARSMAQVGTPVARPMNTMRSRCASGQSFCAWVPMLACDFQPVILVHIQGRSFGQRSACFISLLH